MKKEDVFEQLRNYARDVEKCMSEDIDGSSGCEHEIPAFFLEEEMPPRDQMLSWLEELGRQAALEKDDALIETVRKSIAVVCGIDSDVADMVEVTRHGLDDFFPEWVVALFPSISKGVSPKT